MNQENADTPRTKPLEGRWIFLCRSDHMDMWYSPISRPEDNEATIYRRDTMRPADSGDSSVSLVVGVIAKVRPYYKDALRAMSRLLLAPKTDVDDYLYSMKTLEVS